jgi:hypothetical protein
MPETDFEIAVAFGIQTVQGTALPAISTLTDGDETDGYVLGDPSAGIAESGISVGFERDLREKATVSGSFTKQPSDFLEELVDGFEFAFPLKGNGYASPTLDSHWTPDPGIDALLEACGLGGAGWATGNGWAYTPQSASYITAKIFINGLYYVVKDCIGNLSIDYPPGDIAVATVSFSNPILDSSGLVTFPTIDYGNQSDLSAPAVKSVGHNWGMTAELRGFSQATLEINNETETFPDSNATTGETARQTGRTISLSAQIFGSTTDLDYERTELIRTTAPTDEQSWTIGTAGASTANAVRTILTTPELRKMNPEIGGTAYMIACELVAVDEDADEEFSLIFL